MLLQLRNRHFFISDILLLAIAPTLALSLRVNLPWGVGYAPALILFTLTALTIKLTTFYFFRLYGRYWRFASIDAMLSVIWGVALATGFITGLAYLFQGLDLVEGAGLPRSVPLIDGILTLLIVGGTRFSVRAVEYQKMRSSNRGQRRRVLIVGAGDAGQIVAREMFTSRHISLDPVGFADDNPEKIGSVIHGVRVLGPLEKIPELVEDYKIQEVIIAMPTAPGEVIRSVVRACEEADVSSKILPGIYELLTGQVSVNRLREVQIGDLLRRETVTVDTEQVEQLIKGKRVLVTGAGGSIGSELCTQIANCSPSQLIVLGHGENSLFSLNQSLRAERSAARQSPPSHLSLRTQPFDEAQDKLRGVPVLSPEGEVEGPVLSAVEGRQSPPSTPASPVGGSFDLQVLVADVRDRPRLEMIFSRYHPEIIFHAAAHKHVPLMEENVEEAVTNNILGTWNLVEVAKEYDVEHFVLISTDKAVNPVSVMGMTKRVAELIVRVAAVETGRTFASVRFGNVLGSRGSVVPLFQRQISGGGPVTVTDPEMKRYFMTIPEAVQLVLQASALGQNGEVFILDMGAPIKIDDLARDMIELSGYQVGRDIQIEYTGLRPGERLFELLFFDNENFTRTEHEKIFVTCNGAMPSFDDFESQIEALITLARAGKTQELRHKLTQLTSSPLIESLTA